MGEYGRRYSVRTVDEDLKICFCLTQLTPNRAVLNVFRCHYLSRARMDPETDIVEAVPAGFLAGNFVRKIISGPCVPGTYLIIISINRDR